VTIDDLGLPASFASGDPDSIRAVYQRYGRLMYSVAYKVLGDPGLADDATLRAFVQAWRSAASYDPSRALGAWLATITRRAAIDVYSSAEAHNVWAVRQALAKLPASEREVIRLRHVDHLTDSEIAAQLGLPVGAVKSRSLRAHRRLAGLLGHLHNNSGNGTVSPIRRVGTNRAPLPREGANRDGEF
jgi:RNA polymerase sigma-70 factor (ECF subfamily)